MSTKTTLKRIALVAVSALGFGLLSVAPSQAAVTVGAAAPFVPATTAVGAPVNSALNNYTVSQYAGALNYVTFNPGTYTDSTTNGNVTGADLTGLRVVVTGGTLRSARAATGTCNNAGGTLAVQTLTSGYSAGTWSAYTTPNPNTTRLYAADLGNADCVATFGAGYTTYTALVDAQFTVGTPTAGAITVQVYADEIVLGAATTTLLQTFTIQVIPAAATTFTSATTTISAQGTGYRNPYEGVYAPKTATGAAIGKLNIDQFAGVTPLVNGSSELKTITVQMTGAAGSLDSTVPGASFGVYSAALGNLTNNLDIYVYGDGRGGEATITVTINGVVNSTSKWWFYGQAASIQASAVLGVGRASSTAAKTTGNLTYVDAVACAGVDPLLWSAECIAENEASVALAGGTAGNSTSPKSPGDNNNVAIAVLAKDAMGIPVPYAVTGSSSNIQVVANPLATWLLDGGAGANSAGTYYQHINYVTPVGAVSGSSATLTYSILNADGTVVTSNPVTIKLGGSPVAANVKMTTDKSSYQPGEAGVITITATDSVGNPAYDGAPVFAKVVANTALFTGSLPSTSTTITAGTSTHKFFAPPVAGKWTITATLAADGVTTLTLPVTVAADTSAIDAAADAAAEAIDAANAATDAANLAAEAADAATVAAEEARDAADAATAAVEALATEVAALFAALKAQLTTLANTVAKIAKKVKA